MKYIFCVGIMVSSLLLTVGFKMRLDEMQLRRNQLREALDERDRQMRLTLDAWAKTQNELLEWQKSAKELDAMAKDFGYRVMELQHTNCVMHFFTNMPGHTDGEGSGFINTNSLEWKEYFRENQPK